MSDFDVPKLIEMWAAAERAIDALPREGWGHMRQVDGRWEILENGVAPPAWREMSNSSRLFAIELHNRLEVGDRIVVSEEIYEVSDHRQLVKLAAEEPA